MRALTLLLSAVAIPAFATDLTIVSKVSRNDAPPQTTTSYIAEDHVRMSHGDGHETIVDLKSGQMTTLDNKKKTYYVTTRQDMDAFAARMKEQMNSPEMKKAQEQMKNMPADQQKAMSGMFTFDVHKTGTTRKIAGYTCENWIMKMGQMSTTEECLTNDLQYPAQAWTMYKNFADTMRSAMSAMGPMAQTCGVHAGTVQEDERVPAGDDHDGRHHGPEDDLQERSDRGSEGSGAGVRVGGSVGLHEGRNPDAP